MKIRTGPSLPSGAYPAKPLPSPPVAPDTDRRWSSIDADAARRSLFRERQSRELGWLATMAYEPLTTLPRLLEPHGYRDVEPLSRWWSTGTQAVLAVKDRRAVIAFRGSESTLDWIVDFLFLPVGFQPRHLGFRLAWWSARGQVTGFLARHRGDVDGVEVCGHSLGGAVAKVAAYDLASEYPIEAVVTLGAPRAFWGWAARAYDEKKTTGDLRLGDITRSFVNGTDIVARMPPWFFGFVHTRGAEPSEPDEHQPWFVRLLDRVAAERAGTPLMPTLPPVWPPATVRHGPTPAHAAPEDDVIGWIARAYVWGDKYAQLVTHLAITLVAPVALYALYVWLLVAVIRAALAHPSRGYHAQFFRATWTMPALPFPVRSGSARLAGLGLMSPLIAAGLWLLYPLLMFSWRFAFWVPQTIYGLWLQMNA